MAKRRRRSSGRFGGTVGTHVALAAVAKRNAVEAARSFQRSLRAGRCALAYHALLALTEARGVHDAESRFAPDAATARRAVSRLHAHAEGAFAIRCLKAHL